ncbi:MAG: uncharacterized SAM-binding protein YcdF (DUF218 family) [Alteromonadaceae bacterium]|jgi:uncharacterized SAM-binding protein YcdF (DUF218 family)
MSCAIIVLGSPNDESGNLSPIALSRSEKALSEYNRVGDCKILCTGGFGQHFNSTNVPHGKYLQDHLMSKGVPASSFIDIALSSFTREDATLSKPILEKHSIMDVILVTSDFHMKRAKLVFNRILPNIEFVYSEATTISTDVEFKKLLQHEHNAIERELEYF